MERAQIGISDGDDGVRVGPGATERIPRDAGIEAGGMFRGDVIQHDGGCFQDVEAVSQAARHIDRIGAGGGQFEDDMPVKRRGAAADVENDIHHGTRDAIDDFCMIGRGELEVHAAEHVGVGNGVERFGEVGFEFMGGEGGGLEAFEERAAGVSAGGQENFVTAGDYGVVEFQGLGSGAN